MCHVRQSTPDSGLPAVLPAALPWPRGLSLPADCGPGGSLQAAYSSVESLDCDSTLLSYGCVSMQSGQLKQPRKRTAEDAENPPPGMVYVPGFSSNGFAAFFPQPSLTKDTSGALPACSAAIAGVGLCINMERERIAPLPSLWWRMAKEAKGCCAGRAL